MFEYRNYVGSVYHYQALYSPIKYPICMYRCMCVHYYRYNVVKVDSANSLARVTELEEQLSVAQQEKDLVNEMLQQSQVCMHTML